MKGISCTRVIQIFVVRVVEVKSKRKEEK